jgi:hypothetical protein
VFNSLLAKCGIGNIWDQLLNGYIIPTTTTLINDKIKAFNDKIYEIPLHVKQSMNGDDFESYICNWQKDK